MNKFASGNWNDTAEVQANVKTPKLIFFLHVIASKEIIVKLHF
jgi:hypothetical protein